MSQVHTEVSPADLTARRLTTTFLSHHPQLAARSLESLDVVDAAAILEHQPPAALAAPWPYLVPTYAELLLVSLSPPVREILLGLIDPGIGAGLLARLDDAQRDALLAPLSPTLTAELKDLLDYPDGSTGRMMQCRVLAFPQQLTVADAKARLRARGITRLDHLFLLDDDMLLIGQVDLPQLALATGERLLSSLAHRPAQVLDPFDPIDEVPEKLEGMRLDVVPVVNTTGRLVGVLHIQTLFDTIKEELVTDMAAMVGASRDEKALSSSFFAVKKRLPWLNINLLTAFLASAIVGLFESTIAQFTALAVLLPIAAGQSGNAGAQALAVTMRGLTLREITTRHWLRVMIKEMGTGAINGIAIAVVCGGGVYLWSKSLGLAGVMALSMVISLIIAGMAGALVPMALRRLGLDPAQSSSIVLTTVTDVAGFLSFLGIATLMASWL